jgi:hypothetical protein
MAFGSMFEAFSGAPKYIFAGLVGFACYNEFVIMHRDSVFNGLAAYTSKASVVQSLGEPKHTYICAEKQTPPSFLLYIERLCQEKVEEVDAFPLCYIPLRCSGWNYVAFDHNSKMVTKYHLGK